MFGELLLIASGTLASEDLTLTATGLLIAQGKLGFLPGVAACAVGIFTGDMLIYFAGRVAGLGIHRWSLAARIASPAAIERGARWLEKRGAAAVFLSRFTPGMRLPTYFAAGLLSRQTVRFAGYFLLAALVWTPLLVGAADLFGLRIVAMFASPTARLAAFGGLLATLAATGALVRFETRRRLAAFLKRKVRWEFWPAWATYLPIVPYFLYLAIRHRSLTLFTAANPGIETGGFVGESKTAILRDLAACRGLIAPFESMPWSLDPVARFEEVTDFAAVHGWPVVLKPDVGERGTGVAIVRSENEVSEYVAREAGDLIVQRYVPGVEFGIFYYRYPSESRGRIYSITEKRFPQLIGDGRRTLRELILADGRAVCMAQTYFQLTKHDLDAVPGLGESRQLVEIGSHCRGAIFLDGSDHVTAELSDAIERLSQAHSGFYFGRYDVRSASIHDLRAGRFQVIELNGVAAEATHIYDPRVSLWAAYGIMFHLWRTAFEIGAENRRRGAQPTPLGGLLSAVRGRRRAIEKEKA